MGLAAGLEPLRRPSPALMLPPGRRVFAGLVEEAAGNQQPCRKYLARQATEMVREETLLLPLVTFYPHLRGRDGAWLCVRRREVGDPASRASVWLCFGKSL